ncbi:MAG: metallophosphoesterase [Planctomycetota bacterium]
MIHAKHDSDPAGKEEERLPGSTGRFFVVADLHLDGNPASGERFEKLLHEALARQSEVFILGDMFCYWFGRGHLRSPMFQSELAVLRSACDSGLKVWIVLGNRDFLLDGAFESATGAAIMGDDAEIRLGDGSRVHLSHGDRLNTRDVGHLRMRKVLHAGVVRFLAHHLPAPLVHGMARSLRRYSERTVREKSAWRLEPDREEVRALFRSGYGTVICGHFHRAHDEVFPLDEGGGRFIILEPFEERGFVLTHDDRGWSGRWIGSPGRGVEAHGDRT